MRTILLPICLAACACSTNRSAEGLWVAHRGNSSAAPENTLAAVRSALALEPAPDYVEIDVRRTADGALVVIHDATLDRTTDRTGTVDELSLETVRSADAGFPDRFAAAFSGERVPTLEEVLDLAAESCTGVMIEIKIEAIGAEVARLVAARGETEQHIVASFKADVLAHALMTEPRTRTLFLAGQGREEHVELARRLGVEILGVGHESVTPALVSEARRAGIALWAWTVDDPGRVRALRSTGAQGIISNDLNLVRTLPESPN